MTGQSSPKNIACGMFVGVGGVAATPATKLRLHDAVLDRCVPPRLAAVRSVPRIDLHPGTPSVCRFGAQNRDELAPAFVTDTPVEPSLGSRPVGQIPTGGACVGH